jgi:tetratricopeptide (TPR) repeat protein
MKTTTIIKTTAALILTLMIGVSAAMAQKAIKGTIYRDGKPAAGVEVTAHKSKDSFFTSFDGKYEISIDAKSKYLKFTFPDIEEKYDLEGNTKDVIDFYIGEKPAASSEGASGVDMRSQTELIKANDKDFKNNLSMYDQFYKQKDYNSALEPWTYIYNKYPKSSENIYIKGVRIYDGLISKAAPADKDALFEKMMEIYDNRIKFFGKEGYNKGRKATTYLRYKLETAQTDDELKVIYKTGYSWLESALIKEGNKTEAAVLVQLMQATSFLFKVGEFNSDKILVNYEKCSHVIDSNLKESPDNKTYQIAQKAVNSIFENSGAADCEALTKLYSAKFEADPNNVDLLKKMIQMLGRENCTEGKLYADGAEKLYSLDPSAAAARAMALLFYRRKDFAKAAEYYQQAIDAETDNEAKATYLFELASLRFGQSSFKEARNMAKKSVSLNPNMGKSYILIGKIYAASAKSISEKEFEQRMVYCLAVDYFRKAKSVNPETAVEANTEISRYRQHFPNKENAFFEGFSNGDNYKVGGWINETTKVRVR